MKKLIILFVFLFSLISLASADDFLGNDDGFARNSTVNLLGTCENCSFMNVTKVIYPNSSFAFLGQFGMTKNGTEYNLSFNKTQDLGTYTYTICGDLNGVTTCKNINFKITPNGKSFDSGQSIGSLGIIFGAITLAFFFLYLGLRLGQTAKLIPIGFLFVCLSMMMVVYSLFLSFIFSQDIIQYQSLSSTAEIIFVVILWIIVGAFVTFIALMLIAFIKELNEVVEKRKFGEDWDPISHTYGV